MAHDGPAAYKNMAKLFTKSPILDIGCMFGFVDCFPDGIEYVGIDSFSEWTDEDQVVRFGYTVKDIKRMWTEKETNRPKTAFHVADFVDFLPGKHFGMIVCFEVLEHYPDCREKAEWLKQFCDRLLISVPFHEGAAGARNNGHVFDDLSEKDFPGFIVSAIGYGRIFLLWDKESNNV